MSGPRLEQATLQTFLDEVVPEGGAQVTAVLPVTGGYSRETAIGDVTWADGTSERFVLRADPPSDAGVFQSERDAEWRLLRMLSETTGGVRIAQPRWYDEAGQHFGSKCIVSEFYAGRNMQDMARVDGSKPTREIFVDVVAGIHATPLDELAVELQAPQDWREYLDSLIDLLDWHSRHGEDARPALRYAADRLRTYTPEPVPLSLVHGDCQPGNVLVGAEGPIVIDWEFARIGDPREDLGYYMQMPIPPNIYTDDPESFLAQYRDRTGLSKEQVNTEVVEFFVVLGLVRLYAHEMEGADAVAAGGSRGIMATYLINAVTNQYNGHFQLARRFADRAAAR